MTSTECIKLLYDLLPRGLAWNREIDSNMYKLVSSIAEEISRMDLRLDDLLNEIDPFQTEELLVDFETMLGLPDDCLDGVELSTDERRRFVIAALSALGGSSIEYFEKLLLTLGYTVEIIDYTVARSGNRRCGDRMECGEKIARCGTARCGDSMYNSGWQFWIRVMSNDPVSDYARSGLARCGDRIRTFGNEKIECIMRKLKPAHTAIWFTYGA